MQDPTSVEKTALAHEVDVAQECDVDHFHDGVAQAPEAPIAIDCASCDVRGLACGDCVVTVLLGTPPSWLDDEDQRALGVLAESGLIPPLRLVTSADPAADPATAARRKTLSTSMRGEAMQARDTG